MKTNIITRIRDHAELARSYAEDGELDSAADVLAALTRDVLEQANLSDRFVASLRSRDDLVEVRGVSPVPQQDQQHVDQLHRDMAADPMVRAAGDVFSPHGSGPAPIEPREELK